MARRLLALSPLLLILLAAPVRAEQAVETEHYDVKADYDLDVAATTLLHEAAWKELRAYFKAKPKVGGKDKLPVRLFGTRAAFDAALQAVGASAPDGGCYRPDDRTAYVLRQATPYETRALLLRELARQYHYLARTRNKHPVAAWWRNGVCEFLAGHEWDGSTLKLARGSLSARDLPGEALRRLADVDLAKVIEGETDGGAGLAWALYAHLATGDGGKPLKLFDKFARKMDGGVKPVPMFWKSFGKLDEYRPLFQAWLEKAQQTWVPIQPDWETLGPGRVRATAAAVSACRLNVGATQFHAVIDPPKGKTRWRAGAVLHYANAKDYSIFLVDWAGYLRITRFLDGHWKILEQGPGPGAGADGAYDFELFRKKDKVYLMFQGGASYGPWELPGAGFGLAVENCTLVFRDVRWK